MTSPVVRRMVLFKHGVAYVERGGPCEGAFELSFKREEMKDVLKSLAVWVAAGEARPSAIAFDKPEDPESALAEKGLALPADRTIAALLTAFRGRRVVVREGDAAVAGEVVGLEARPVAGEGIRQLLALRVERGAVRIVDLERVSGLELDDPVAAADLEFLLDRRRAATSSERRAVHVAIEGRAEDLRVAYVVPAPVWRVSYRLVRDGAATVISAWAIVHNPLDEDVRDVSLTLTTGQPISFDIDLYRPKTVQRVVVEESSRAAAAPTKFEAPRAKGAPPPRPGAPPPAAMPAAFGPPMAGAAPAPALPPAAQPAMLLEQLLDAGDGAATLEDRGELFEYRIAQPITLPRGGSALAPLVAAKVDAVRERIWRDGGPPAPDLVVAFRNGTGAVLEEGPAVIYDEGVYAGEAMVPYTVRGAEVKLAYAKDLAVRCKRDSKTRVVNTGLHLADRFVAEEQRIEDEHLLRADSDHDQEIEVVFELAKRSDRTVAEGRGERPFEETASFRRFRAKVAPRSHVELQVVEIGHGRNWIQYASLTPVQLEQWLRAGILSGPVGDSLGEVVQAWAEAQAHDRRVQALEAEKSGVQNGQGRIAQQLGVLKDGGPEGELRLRYVRELAQAQDRVLAIEKEIAASREAADGARRRAELRLGQMLQSPRG